MAPVSSSAPCNNAMGLWSKIKGKGTLFESSDLIGEAIVKNLPQSAMIESCSVGQHGFVNITLSNKWMAKSSGGLLSPNIAKEMHVGHLRSTIIGDTLARMLEFSNVEVLRRNHVGDWGTQFGMLIEFFFEKFPSKDISSDQAIGDLEAFYKASKQRFDNDPVFKERAQRAVVSLQAGDEKYRKAWAQICEISRRGYEKVYQRLGVHLEEKGESFYNPYIPAVLKLLDEKGLIEESEGARVVPIEGKRIPLIVVKKDGGYNYASTDLAALWYRLNEERAEWIIYVTDVGQREHFEMVFALAMLDLGLFWEKMGSGFNSSTETVKLVDLLDEAKSRSKEALVQRGKAKEWTADELDGTAEAVSYGAVKYADLKNNRTTNYTFSFDQMLNDKVIMEFAIYSIIFFIFLAVFRNKQTVGYFISGYGQLVLDSGFLLTKVSLLIAVYWILSREILLSIYNMPMLVSAPSSSDRIGPVELAHPDERALGLRLLQFPEIVEEACTKLLPSVICEYLYNLSEDATRLYTNCQVVGSAEETSRLLLCEATGVVMRKCFYLLGIIPVNKI
ncbi:hypothetical protein DH2020_029705 [Rehmannia glutinosa]|uniref:arginine--tRNA ligase n=1 Tax=Rehmannia glutinosa TaxID=99300 RepID=A0ABR0VRG0_REHGL